MKLKRDHGNDKSFDLVKEELEYLREQTDAYWNDIRNLMKHAIPAYDDKGHFSEIRVKVRHMQMDVISKIREMLPDGWFKSQSALIRGIIAVGCKTYLEELRHGKSEWDAILMTINEIAKKQRMEEFQKEIEIMKSDVVHGSLSPQKKIKRIDQIAKLAERMFEIEGYQVKGTSGTLEESNNGKA